jgi:hypothetical protein
LRPTLERDVTAYLFQLLREEDLFDKVRARQETAQEAVLSKELKRLEAQLDQLPKRKERLFDLYERGLIKQDEFLERKEAHDRFQGHCLQEAQTRREDLERTRNVRLTHERFETGLASLEEDWRIGDIRKKKVALAALIEKIVIKDRTFKIHFRIGS